jgi:hypothetical protein
MNKLARNLLAALCLTTLAASFAGCNRLADPTPAPVRETNETRAENGMQSYGGNRAPAEDRQIVPDERNSAVRAAGRKPFSAHGMAYELESMEAVKGASVIIVGRDAFVGIHNAYSGNLPADVPPAIVNKIRKMDNMVRRVYITEEEDAVQFLKDYAQALEQGMPLRDYENRFADMVNTHTWMTGS